MRKHRCVSVVRNEISVLVAYSTVAALTVMGACTSAHQVQDTSSYDVAGSMSHRGIHPEPGGLVFDHALQVRRSGNGVPRELHTGDTLMTGDRIRVTVQPSEDAHLYLAFCDRGDLAVYPAPGGFRTKAGEVTVVPPGSAALVVDAELGVEVLYVILSRTELTFEDSRLAHALTATRQRDNSAGCEGGSDAGLAELSHSKGGPKAPGSADRLGDTPGARMRPRPPTRRPHPPGAGTASASSPSLPGLDLAEGMSPLSIDSVDPFAPPIPDFERTVERPRNIVWYRPIETMSDETHAASSDDIAVVRYTFTHIPQATRPSTR